MNYTPFDVSYILITSKNSENNNIYIAINFVENGKLNKNINP